MSSRLQRLLSGLEKFSSSRTYDDRNSSINDSIVKRNGNELAGEILQKRSLEEMENVSLTPLDLFRVGSKDEPSTTRTISDKVCLSPICNMSNLTAALTGFQFSLSLQV